MKKIDIKDETTEKTKVTIKTIKKNPDSDVLHTIKRVKAEERRAVLILASIILAGLFLLSFFIFSSMTEYDGVKEEKGPLLVRYINDDDGMGDIVDFNGEQGEAHVFSTEFTISNNSSKNSWYAVYLDDYTDMIKYDKCFDKMADKKKIYFSIDGSEARDLASVYDDGRYAIIQDIVSSNDEVSHVLQIWYSEDINGHYHGKIDVEYLR